MKKPFNLMKFDEISKKKATKFEAKQLQQKAERDKKPKSVEIQQHWITPFMKEESHVSKPKI